MENLLRAQELLIITQYKSFKIRSKTGKSGTDIKIYRQFYYFDNNKIGYNKDT